MLTLAKFTENALRDAERAIGAPPGWWGTWRDLRDTFGWRVRGSRGVWSVFDPAGKRISEHDVRAQAIRKAARLSSQSDASVVS